MPAEEPTQYQITPARAESTYSKISRLVPDEYEKWEKYQKLQRTLVPDSKLYEYLEEEKYFDYLFFSTIATILLSALSAPLLYFEIPASNIFFAIVFSGLMVLLCLNLAAFALLPRVEESERVTARHSIFWHQAKISEEIEALLDKMLSIAPENEKLDFYLLVKNRRRYNYFSEKSVNIYLISTWMGGNLHIATWMEDIK
jgi:hypothetical protein